MPFYEDFGREFHYYYKTKLAKNVSSAHLHPEYELGLFLHDSPQVSLINGNETAYPFPTAVLLSPYCLHERRFDFKEGEDPWERGIFYFGETLIEKYPDVFAELPRGQNCVWRLDEESVRHFHEILAMMNRYPLDSVEQQLLFFLVIKKLFSMKEAEIPLAEASEKEQYIGDVIRYMSENLSEGLTADSVAAHFFISRSKLNKDFKRYTSTTFHQLLAEMKMNKAIGFLKRGNTDIRKIAIASGFENESYFFALFKKKMGTTPMQYAKSQKEKIEKQGFYRDPKMVSSDWGMTLDF